jgi:peptidoglycan/LPS O-acetylase OafA/YrhL
MRQLPHTPPADRMQLLDSVRLVAAVGVIISHVTTELYPDSPLWAMGSFSVPFYLFAALYFTVRGFKKDPQRQTGTYLLGRVLKLYLPFVVWNFAYEIMHKLKYPQIPMTSPSTMLWGATYAHLYFLPLLGVATLVVVLLMKPIQRSPLFRVALSVILVALAILSTMLWQPAPLSIDPPADEQTIHHVLRTLPSALLAIVFAIWAGTRSKPLHVSPKAGLLGVALMLTTLTYQIQFEPQPILRTLSGLGLVLIAFTPFYSPNLKPVAMIGRYSYGIYLSHVAFIRIGLNLAAHFGIPQGLSLAIGVGCFALISGALLSMILAQSKWSSWIVGCDVGTSTRDSSVSPATSSPPQTARLQTPDRLENVPH